MCKKVSECLKSDDDFKDWILDIVQDDLQSSILLKVLSIVIVISSKNLDIILGWFK